MPYAECSNDTCSTCVCPACGGRGDLCSCSQAEFNQARARQIAGLPARPEMPHEAWSPAQAWQHTPFRRAAFEYHEAKRRGQE